MSSAARDGPRAESAPHPGGPSAPPVVLGSDVDLSAFGATRPLRADPRLQETSGVLHPGVAAGAVIAAARHADPASAPVTAVDLHFERDVALGDLQVACRPHIVGRIECALLDGARPVAGGHVELAGHDVVARVADLQHLAQAPLTDPEVGHLACWVCSPGMDGLVLPPRRVGPGAQSVPWIPADDTARVVGIERLGPAPNGRGRTRRRQREGAEVDVAAIAAALVCPARWATADELGWPGARAARLVHLHVRFFRRLDVLEPVRVVARHDDAPTPRARAAVMDEDGAVFATAAAAFHLPAG